MKRIEQKVSKFIDENGLFNAGDKVLVALSGGPDSVFLLYFLNNYKKKYKIDLCAVHFNHKLRGKESNLDEKFVERLCSSLNIPLVVGKLNVKTFAASNKLSIEEAARKLRYLKMETLAGDLNCTKIATAHNLSDNTETILINLFSGTGGTGLSGIPIRRGKIVRPVLCVAKTEIMDYLDSKKIKYRIDSSNRSDVYKRNFIRNRVLPLIRAKINPSVDGALFRSLKNLDNEIRFNRSAIEFFLKKFVKREGNSISISINILKIFDNEIPGLLLKEIMQKYFDHDFEYDDYIKINSLLTKQKGRRIELSKDLIAFREDKEIRIEHVLKSSNQAKELHPDEEIKIGSVTVGVEHIDRRHVKFGGSGNVEFISGDGMSDKFRIRPWAAGDKFKPLGMQGFKKVSDFLTDCKIPTSKRNNQLVLLNRNHIVWIIGLRIDDRYKVNSKTKTVYKLWMN